MIRKPFCLQHIAVLGSDRRILAHCVKPARYHSTLETVGAMVTRKECAMQLGMIGLGRMGANMARRLMRGGHHCVVYDRNPDAVKALAAEGATGAGSLADMIAAMTAPRHIWIMVPAGGPTESTVEALGQQLEPGDTIIDGGNSYFKDDIRRAKALAPRHIQTVGALIHEMHKSAV